MKRILALLLLVMLVFTLVGCSKEAESGTNTQTNVGGISNQDTTENTNTNSEAVWKVTLMRGYETPTEVNKKSLYFYDEFGRTVFEEHYGNEEETIRFPFYRYTYHEDGSYTVENSLEKYEYDKNGNELRYESVALVRISTYDENGNMTSRKFGDDALARTEYAYDERNNMIQERSYADDGSLRLESLYEYDDRNNLIREESIYEDSHGVTEYTYNEVNAVTSEKHYSNGDLDHEYYCEYTYNEAGDLLTQDSVSGGGPNSSYTGTIEYHAKYTYNEKGLLVSLIAGSALSDTNIDNTRYEYDENGNLTYVLYLTDDGYINHERFYEYDADGNVILDHVSYENYEGGVKKSDSLTKYAYDEHGNMTMEENYLNHEFNYSYEWTYELVHVTK